MIFSTMIKALRGRALWLKAKRKYKIAQGSNYILLMPDSDREFNEHILRHIDDFLEYHRGDSVVILTTDEWVEGNAGDFSKRISAVERIPQHWYYCYYCYYYYYDFSQQFLLMSLKGIYGERLGLAECINDITKEDLSCLGLYTMRNWKGVGMPDG